MTGSEPIGKALRSERGASSVVQSADFFGIARCYAVFTRCFPQGFPQSVWMQAARSEGLPEAGRTLVRVSHYLDELGRLYDDPQERDARAGSVQEFVNAMAAHAEREESPSLSGFLAEIALAGRELGSEEDRLRSKNAVWLLTLHAAKGLEFPVVYMVGMEDGILPHQRSSDESLQGVDEERRLCYVGVTRAQENLTLSLALERMKWGKPRPTTPSRFLYELTGQAERASDSPQKMKQRGVRARRG